MCVIVDINVADRVLLKDNDTDYKLINLALRTKQIVLIYGGQLAEEYGRNNKVRRFVLSLDRAGAAHRVRETLIDAETNWLEQHKGCVSNDQHIIALARASGARLLCSNDQDLGRDFGNKSLVDTPRGKIYKNSLHKHLLRRACQFLR